MPAFLLPALKTVATGLASKAASKALTKDQPQQPQGVQGASVYNLPESKLKGMITQMDETQYQQFLSEAPQEFRQQYPDLPYL